MAYVEAHQALLTHRKTLRLARLLSMDRFATIGRLLALWWWALDNAPEGKIAVSDGELLADVMGWDGSSDELCSALVSAGWLEEGDDGYYIIHDWFDYVGKLIERRAQNAARTRNARASRDDEGSEERALHVQNTWRARAGANVTKRSLTEHSQPSENSYQSSVGKHTPEADAQATNDAGASASAGALGESPNKSHQKTFSPDQEPYQLATRLRDAILAHNPRATDALKAETPQGLQAWARKMETLAHDKKRTASEVAAVIAYGVGDPFWRPHLLNPDKLKKHFDTIDGQRREGNNRHASTAKSNAGKAHASNVGSHAGAVWDTTDYAALAITANTTDEELRALGLLPSDTTTSEHRGTAGANNGHAPTTHTATH